MNVRNGSTRDRKSLKIVILGDSGVGKTSLLNRFSTDKFTGQYKATIGADFCTKEMVVTDSFGQRHYCTLQLWDTAGQERFQSLGVGFYRGSDAAILVYDITDVHSLANLEHWKTEFLNHVGGGSGIGMMSSSNMPQFPFVVVGNKMDKEKDRRVPFQRAEEWCRDQSGSGAGGVAAYSQYASLPHFEASAKTAWNVQEAFEEVARLALHYEDAKRRAQPQLFVPPPVEPIDLRRQTSTMSQDPYHQQNQGCC